MAISKDFLWDTITQLASELQRVDPGSVVAARVSGFIEARQMGLHTSDRHLENKRTYKDPEEDAHIASLYLSGQTLERVALATGHSTGMVRDALARQGVTARNCNEKVAARHRGGERIERIRAMRAAGKTLEEIGAELHITRERVRQLCLKGGVDPERGLTPDQLAAVQEYLGGGSLIDVAERHGVTYGRLKGWIAKAGEKLRPKKRRREPHTITRSERAARLYQQGVTTGQIAETLGVQQPTVYRLLAIAGVSPSRRNQEAA